MASAQMPQMTESAYIAIREAFRKSLPSRITPAWVMANVAGYKTEGSAKAVMRYMAILGLVGPDSETTELAKQWRMDSTYPDACDAMLRLAFPADIVEAVPSDGASIDVLINLFMTRGLGEGSAKNLARIYRLIASRVPPEGKKPRAGAGESASQGSKTRPSVIKHARAESSTNSVIDNQMSAPPPPSDQGMFVLRYFLDRGRLAEIRLPRDLDERERRRLFAYLRIDLLDEVAD